MNTKINIMVRLRNPILILNLVIAIGLVILSYFSLDAKDMTTWGAIGDTLLRTVKNPYLVLQVLWTIWNAVYDPTTKGIGDTADVIAAEKPITDESSQPSG